MRCLDLFCGAGGAAMGYHQAGFEVVGWDIEHHPDYPFEHHVGDALEVLTDVDYVRSFDLVHASPPCQAYSTATRDRSRYGSGPRGRGHEGPNMRVVYQNGQSSSCPAPGWAASQPPDC